MRSSSTWTMWYLGGRFCRLRGNFEIQAAAVKQFGFFPCFGRLGVSNLAVV
nr:MAG TPA: hypothetical protein [Caudoviricetes sp.]